MIAGSSSKRSGIATFRSKLSAAMMLVVAAITAFGFYLAQRNIARNAERALRQNFQTELSALDKLLELRHAAVTERCQKIGYIANDDSSGDTIQEITAVPIFSIETGDVISALVLGFRPLELFRQIAATGMRSGIWANGRLHLPTLEKSAQEFLAGEITNAFMKSKRLENKFRVTVNGAPHLLFYK